MSNADQPEPDALREAYDGAVPPLAPPDVFDPVIEAYKKDVDRTLIRESLKLSVAERVERMVRNTRAIDAFRRSRGYDKPHGR